MPLKGALLPINRLIYANIALIYANFALKELNFISFEFIFL